MMIKSKLSEKLQLSCHYQKIEDKGKLLDFSIDDLESIISLT